VLTACDRFQVYSAQQDTRETRLSHFATQSTTGRNALALLLATFLVLFPPAGPTNAQQSESERLQAEIEQQQALLDQLQRRHAAVQEPEPEAAPLLDARAAPPAPSLRELPIAIFDEATETIAEGTWGNPDRMRVRRLSLDADGDGQPELIRYLSPESGLLLRQEKDRNYDGRLDEVRVFEWGAITHRALDDDDDGQPDGWEDYERDELVHRTLDRDRDGTRDAFYDYQGGSLVLERHDGDNDGRVDRTIHYRDRHRTHAEEDLDRDGRTDIWYRYGTRAGTEFVTRVERDKRGQGTANVVETFIASGDGSQLDRREEDVDGDGKTDIVSIFRDGKLVRRELASPDLRPL